MEDTKVIQSIQLKRGVKERLELILTKENGKQPLKGEPIWEIDTNSLKIGDGENDYIDLAYITGGGGGKDSRFVIQDPQSNQILIYDENTQKWVNKDLADKESIIYLSNRGLTIKGYENATQGQMLVKDVNVGLTWVDPVSDQKIAAATAAAEASMNQAGAYALNAGKSAGEAAVSVTQAQTINQQTMAYVNDKFWWGTAEEYNKLSSITPGTFYFIKA